ncbi:hypothetical protein M422DRAFT_259752 [Sphaerobolus stellatus SS14]|uniref:Uncharacterized protein n=1 Tax=Sphaerobolus stellatus (strain SS14) TaxID=990650 RepID=A0A0C9U3Z3_SPHS4|nr:hypothetical protein M422DRAFT_259752 [Sphaerobolus stellatus SS14]
MAHSNVPDDIPHISHFSDNSNDEAVAIEAAHAVRRSRPVHPFFAAAINANDVETRNGADIDDNYSAVEAARQTVQHSCPPSRQFGSPSSTNRTAVVINAASSRHFPIVEEESTGVSDTSDSSTSAMEENSDQLEWDESNNIASWAERKSLPLETEPRTHIKNPLSFNVEDVIGSTQFKIQCARDWDELPFTTMGALCRSIKFGINMTALIWWDVHGPNKETIKMNYLNSTLDRIGHGVDVTKYHAKLKLFDKITLKQYGLFNVQFSLFWKVPLITVRGSCASSRALVALRHNLLAPNAYASINAEHKQMLTMYVLYKSNELRGRESFYDIQ